MRNSPPLYMFPPHAHALFMITGPMSRIGRIGAAYDTISMYLDPYTNGLYAGYYSYPPAGDMWTVSGSSALPTLVSTITDWGGQSGIDTNKVRRGEAWGESAAARIVCCHTNTPYTSVV